jgi:hypothetical protein
VPLAMKLNNISCGATYLCCSMVGATMTCYEWSERIFSSCQSPARALKSMRFITVMHTFWWNWIIRLVDNCQMPQLVWMHHLIGQGKPQPKPTAWTTYWHAYPWVLSKCSYCHLPLYLIVLNSFIITIGKDILDRRSQNRSSSG